MPRGPRGEKRPAHVIGNAVGGDADRDRRGKRGTRRRSREERRCSELGARSRKGSGEEASTPENALPRLCVGKRVRRVEKTFLFSFCGPAQFNIEGGGAR